MIQFILQKIKNKKGLNICLLAGIALLTAMFTCHPMLERCSSNELLLSAFEDYADENQEFPAVFSRSGSYGIDEYATAEAVMERLDAYEEKWTQYVDINTLASQQYLSLSGSHADTNLGKKNLFVSIGLLRDMDSHIRMVKEADAESEAALQKALEEGAIPCRVSESVMDDYGLVLGEVMDFPYAVNGQEESAKIVVSGIFTEKEPSDLYWYHSLEDFGKTIFVNEADFDWIASEFGFETIGYEVNQMLDYTQIDCERAEAYHSYIESFKKMDTSFSTNMLSTLEEYEKQHETVQTILWVLELPCIVLLLLFLYMVADQIVHVEETEISVLRSRGVTRWQVLRLYAIQSLLLSLIGIVSGTLIGFLMCQLAARTDAFLHFTSRQIGFSVLTWKTIPFALAAGIIVLLFLLIPVWRKAKNTVVELTRVETNLTAKMFWEKYFLDVILLIISCYLLYNYSKQSELISQSVLNGEALDPLIFLDASLFIFSCGLVFLRLTKYLIRLIDRLGKRRWNAAMYASFLQIIRTFRKQGFLSVFLIMTVACGIFDANMARTINENSEERIRYDVGTDMRVQEKWRMHTIRREDGSRLWSYEEPDFGRYTALVDDGICESVTRVIVDDDVDVQTGGHLLQDCQLLGIHTREFGETAQLLDGLNDEHWFHALNSLAENVDGVIISSNLAKEFEISEGDIINYTRYAPIGDDDPIAVASGTVCAIVDAFPGYDRYIEVQRNDGITELEENYLVVGNYATIVSQFAMMPYQVWMRLAPSADAGQVRDMLSEEGVSLAWTISTDEEVAKNRSSALIQVTNGMFTTSFVVTLIVCVVGFLIYWIMSIENRQLMFGIYRAMGMKMKEIQFMLLWEQVFGSLFPIVIGGVVGVLGTALFVQLIALVYLPMKHNIDIQVFLYGPDILKLFAVVFLAVCICALVLRERLKKIKIAQALKLGED